jgi:hypothetical protein
MHLLILLANRKAKPAFGKPPMQRKKAAAAICCVGLVSNVDFASTFSPAGEGCGNPEGS